MAAWKTRACCAMGEALGKRRAKAQMSGRSRFPTQDSPRCKQASCPQAITTTTTTTTERVWCLKGRLKPASRSLGVLALQGGASGATCRLLISQCGAQASCVLLLLWRLSLWRRRYSKGAPRSHCPWRRAPFASLQLARARNCAGCAERRAI